MITVIANAMANTDNTPVTLYEAIVFVDVFTITFVVNAGEVPLKTIK